MNRITNYSWPPVRERNRIINCSRSPGKVHAREKGKLVHAASNLAVVQDHCKGGILGIIPSSCWYIGVTAGVHGLQTGLHTGYKKRSGWSEW